MDEFFFDKRFAQLMRRSLHRLGRDPECVPERIDEDLCDALAREVAAAKPAQLPMDIRLEALRNLVQPSPGGVMAFAWLCSQGEVDARKMQQYAGILCHPGFPTQLESAASRIPLSKKDTLVAAEAILLNSDLSVNELTGVAMALFVSDFFCEEGRCALLERISSLSCFTSAARNIIFQWALAIDVSGGISPDSIPFIDDIPLPPNFLARPAVLCCAISSSLTPAKLARYIRDNVNTFEDAVPSLLGLLEMFEQLPLTNLPQQDVPNDLRSSIFELCINSSNPNLRRRGYIVASADDPSYRQRALQDPNLDVRRWATSKGNL